MPLQLLTIPLADLHVLARSEAPCSPGLNFAEEALLPDFVAVRSLEQLQAGVAEDWCRPFYMLLSEDQSVVGTCGFIDEPVNGLVEIGYEVSPVCRRQGFASAAVSELLRMAFAKKEVSEVLAQINPGNAPSSRVAQKLGFKNSGYLHEIAGEPLLLWRCPRPLR